MLQISQYDASNLLIQSAEISKVIANPFNYDKVIISAGKNCCTTKYTDTITIPTSVSNPPIFPWLVNLPKSTTSSLIVTAIWFRNSLTGEFFSVNLGGPVTVTGCSDLTTITGLSNTFFAGLTAWLPLGTTCTTTTALYVYTIQNTNTNFVPYRVDYTLGSVPGTQYFQFTFASGGSWLNSVGLVVPSTLMGDSLLVNGIYNIDVTCKLPSGSFIKESNCWFSDVDLKCKIAEKVADITLPTDVQMEYAILHWTLVQGSNCGCSCTELCDIYSRLSTMLQLTTSQTNPCGC